MIVIVDHSKLVLTLGKAKLPVEVLFFGSPATRAKIEGLGHKSRWRLNDDETLFITENGNLLLDIHFQSPPLAPESVHESICQIPGVVDTGFFFNLAGRVIVGYPDGKTQLR
jgi:ribose 5-phosphate isomerase A